MKKEFIDAINDGELVKNQVFVTDRGTYKLMHVRKGVDIYFYKYLNDELVECCHLNKLEGRRIE